MPNLTHVLEEFEEMGIEPKTVHIPGQLCDDMLAEDENEAKQYQKTMRNNYTKETFENSQMNCDNACPASGTTRFTTFSDTDWQILQQGNIYVKKKNTVKIID